MKNFRYSKICDYLSLELLVIIFSNLILCNVLVFKLPIIFTIGIATATGHFSLASIILVLLTIFRLTEFIILPIAYSIIDKKTNKNNIKVLINNIKFSRMTRIVILTTGLFISFVIAFIFKFILNFNYIAEVPFAILIAFLGLFGDYFVMYLYLSLKKYIIAAINKIKNFLENRNLLRYLTILSYIALFFIFELLFHSFKPLPIDAEYDSLTPIAFFIFGLWAFLYIIVFSIFSIMIIKSNKDKITLYLFNNFKFPFLILCSFIILDKIYLHFYSVPNLGTYLYFDSITMKYLIPIYFISLINATRVSENKIIKKYRFLIYLLEIAVFVGIFSLIIVNFFNKI